MLKLMKYEFRKMRTVLLVLALALIGLELGFVLGYKLEKPDVWGISLVLLTLLAFGAYAYMLVSGIVSYSRELTNRTGCLVFMTPTRPISVVLSKLVFTILIAVAATAVFGVAAYFDYVYLFGRLDIDPRIIDEIRREVNMALMAAFTDVTMNVDKLGLIILYSVASALIEVMFIMCTAYLAITFSATFLQNKKGFVRGLVSFLLFAVITWAAGQGSRAISKAMPNPTTLARMFRLLAAVLGYYLTLSGVFAWLSASLLKHKVSL